MKKKRLIILIIFVLLLIIGALFVIRFLLIPPLPVPENKIPEIVPDIVLMDVPFIVQAPFGQWGNPLYQSACEEASMFMAKLWLEGIASVSSAEATESIKKIAEFEEKRFNTFYDLSIFDSAELMKEYYNYDNVEAKNGITADDIIQELIKGNLVIVPVSGQKLNNLFYTLPGPLEHNLLIRGYDFKTDEFITNDSGTRHGEEYRYPKQILEDVIRAYPTGHKEPVINIQKAMMIIKGPV